MKNEAELKALLDDVCKHGAGALRPDFAGRVLARRRALRDELKTSGIFGIGLATAAACLALTLAISAWKSHDASARAIEQWSSFTIDAAEDQET